MIQVFSSGGGTQSCCIAALIVQGKLPQPDICVIADTGYENERTWDYLYSTVMPELVAVGVEVHRIKASEYAAPWGNPLVHKGFAASGQLMIPAYTDMSGNVACLSKLSTYCSNAWKQEVVDRWLSKERNITRSMMVKWIGFSRDECKRVWRMAKGEEYQKGLIRFPLIHDVPTTRQEAINIVKAMGWPTPPRSRCWMCGRLRHTPKCGSAPLNSRDSFGSATRTPFYTEVASRLMKLILQRKMIYSPGSVKAGIAFYDAFRFHATKPPALTPAQISLASHLATPHTSKAS